MNQKQQAFVLAYLKTSDKIEAYLAVAKEDSLTPEEAMYWANQMLQHPEVAKEMEDITDNMKVNLIIEMESTLPLTLTEHDSRVILAAIATGEMFAHAHGLGMTCPTCGMHEHPTFEGMINAVSLDCKPCIATAYTFLMAQQVGKNRKARKKGKE